MSKPDRRKVSTWADLPPLPVDEQELKDDAPTLIDQKGVQASPSDWKSLRPAPLPPVEQKAVVPRTGDLVAISSRSLQKDSTDPDVYRGQEQALFGSHIDVGDNASGDSFVLEEADSASPQKPSGSTLGTWIKGIVLVLFLLCMGVGGWVGWFIWTATRDLPSLHNVEDYHPWRISRILDKDGNLVMEIAKERRSPVDIKDLPKGLIDAFVAAEDASFFKHQGLDYLGIARAFFKNLRRRKGEPKQGGSTITQQVVKTFLLTKKQTYTRKIREAVLSRRLEQNFNKKQILYLYLNQIYFGRGRYGVQEASRYYFKKDIKDLSISQYAILAGIPKNPERYNPVNSIKDTTRRRNYVLQRMLANKLITPKQYKAAKAEVIVKPTYKAPPFQKDYYTEEVRRRVLKILERYFAKKYTDPKQRKLKAQEALLTGGLSIVTALDPTLQKMAIASVKRGLLKVHRRQGFQLPIRNVGTDKIARTIKHLTRIQKPDGSDRLFRAVVTEVHRRGVNVSLGRLSGTIRWNDMRWARKRKRRHRRRRKRWIVRYKPVRALLKKGDMIWVRSRPRTLVDDDGKLFFQLAQHPTVQGSMVVIEPRTHRVRALVGGYDFHRSSFNRATQAIRQPGSAFKPFVYATAIASRRMAASSLVKDEKFTIKVGRRRWTPKNYTRRFSDKEMSLRYALKKSVNTVAVRVLQQTGVTNVIAYARQLGISTPLAPYLPLALGSSGVKAIELTNAYATFAAQGIYDRPVLVTRITNVKGDVIYERFPNPRPRLNAGVAYIVSSMMQDVVQSGTALRARRLRRPVAGKTGTTNGSTNAWFLGYTPELCVGVWVGYDDRSRLGRGHSGGRTALPIFVDFMKNVYKVRDPQWKNVQTFNIPETVFFARIDPKTGDIPKDDDLPYVFAPFLKGTEPKPPVPKVLKLAPADRKPTLKVKDSLAPKNDMILPKPPQLRGSNP